MAASLVIGRRKIKFRFLIFSLLFFLGAFYLYTISRPLDSYAAISYGEVLLNDSGPAIIVRKESLYTAPAYGKAIYSVADGASVNTDQTVAFLYKENYNEDITKQLYIIQEKIINYQQDQLLDEVLDVDIIKLNKDMDTLIASVQDLVRDHTLQPLVQKESQLRRLLEQKQKLLDLRIEPDSYLTQLYKDEADILNQMKDWTIDIVAPESGLISFSLDGYENILDNNAVDKLTYKDFRQILNQPPLVEESDLAKAEQPFFRIVEPLSSWYAVIETNDAETYYDKGEAVEVSFDEGETQSASIYRIIREKENSLIILEFSGGIDRIINKRITSIHILKAVEGLKVPDSALANYKGKPGVYIKDRDKNVFIEISVKAIADGYAIVESISDNQVLRLHNQVKIAN